MPLNARGAMLGTVAGRHQSPHRGSSVEFAEYRRYQPGDELRRLDWRAFGRSDRYYVKEFEADTNLRMMLVLDASGSMAFGSKLEVARQIIATLAYLAVGQGDAAGLICASADDGEMLPPRRVAGQVNVLFNKLGRVRAEGETLLDQSLHELAERIRERALVIVVSDLFLEPQRIRQAMEHLAFRKHDTAVFQVVDPLEMNPDWHRPTRLQDLETDEAVAVEPDEIRAGYERAVREHFDAIGEIVRETATDYALVMTDQPVEDSLSQFISGRRRDQSR